MAKPLISLEKQQSKDKDMTEMWFRYCLIPFSLDFVMQIDLTYISSLAWFIPDSLKTLFESDAYIKCKIKSLSSFFFYHILCNNTQGIWKDAHVRITASFF